MRNTRHVTGLSKSVRGTLSLLHPESATGLPTQSRSQSPCSGLEATRELPPLTSLTVPLLLFPTLNTLPWPPPWP